MHEATIQMMPVMSGGGPGEVEEFATVDDYNNKVETNKENGKLLIIHFYASWSPPC